MKNILKISVLMLILGFSMNAYSAPYKNITAEQLVKMQKNNKDLVIIDSRSGDWFDGIIIKGATQLSTSDTDSENLARLAPGKDQPIVFYCVNEECPASVKAAIKTSKLGYKNIYEYKGGIEDWKKRGLPTMQIAKKN